MLPLGQAPTYGDFMMGRAEGTLRMPQPTMTKPKENPVTQRNPIDYTHDEIIRTCETMLRFGGGFAQHIANATYAADLTNRETLLKAFAGLFHKYGPDSDFYKSNA